LSLDPDTIEGRPVSRLECPECGFLGFVEGSADLLLDRMAQEVGDD
jgi:hypothetical protein